MIHEWKGLHEYYSMKSEKFDFPKKHDELSVSTVMFCKQFLAYTVQIEWCCH